MGRQLCCLWHPPVPVPTKDTWQSFAFDLKKEEEEKAFLLPAPYKALVFLASSLQGLANEEEFLQILTKASLSGEQSVWSYHGPMGRLAYLTKSQLWGRIHYTQGLTCAMWFN